MDAVNPAININNQTKILSKEKMPYREEIKKTHQYGKTHIQSAAASTQNKKEVLSEDPYQKHYDKYKVGLSYLDDPSKELVKREIRIQVKTKANATENRRRKKPGYKKPKITPAVIQSKANATPSQTPKKDASKKIERTDTPASVDSAESTAISSLAGCETPSELADNLRVSIKPIEQKKQTDPEKSVTKQIERIRIQSFSAIKDVFARLSQPFHKTTKQIHPDS